MKYLKGIFCIVILANFCISINIIASENNFKKISLNGEWKIGFERQYSSKVQVPSIANDSTLYLVLSKVN